MKMKFLLSAAGVLVMIACLIPFFALTSSYERAMAAPPKEGRVVMVEGAEVTYEIHDPDSPWEKDADGWVGPYVDEDIPAAAREKLSPGAPLVMREGKPEFSLSPPSKLLLLGALAGLLLAIWAFVAPILERRAFAAAGNDPKSIFIFMVKKTRNARLLGGPLLVLLGVLVGVVPFVDEDAGTGSVVFLVGLGGVGVLFGLFVLARAIPLLDPSRSAIVRSLEETPERIVWVYEYIIEVDGIRNFNVFICFDDGNRFEMNLRQLEPDPLLSALRERLPHAVFGYNRELDSLFGQAPAQFLQAARREG
ncbi:hypothetical protein [Paraliomyxa miuraensis]|uniref:hypothetical protein n=1 Tax=Paraliomyxa miuraensis TaxID=376150 RepID=UPI0022591148|nr:hypothetical protein [Paraliomyxa miuraensis]MCX4247104.1 hypothetical protein [Paraliomyxa miuraensis]